MTVEKLNISYINVQKSKDFNPQEKRERKISRRAGRQAGRKDRPDNNNLGNARVAQLVLYNLREVNI